MRAHTASEAHERDPVLYLRFFSADAQADWSANDKLLNKLLTGLWSPGLVLQVQSEEGQIAEAFEPVGPLAAIGWPGQCLPRLDAARMYTSDDEWQAAVLEVLHRSGIVLMRVGETLGFWLQVATATGALPISCCAPEWSLQRHCSVDWLIPARRPCCWQPRPPCCSCLSCWRPPHYEPRQAGCCSVSARWMGMACGRAQAKRVAPVRQVHPGMAVLPNRL